MFFDFKENFQHFTFVNLRIRFLMSQTGFTFQIFCLHFIENDK